MGKIEILLEDFLVQVCIALYNLRLDQIFDLELLD